MLKNKNKTIPPFELWLEFEEVEPWEDLTNDFANIGVNLLDGRYYGINVWTYQFVQTAYEEEKAQGKSSNGLYLMPPDLLVQELSRACIEHTIKDLLSKGTLEEQLNPSIFGLRFTKPWQEHYESTEDEKAAAAFEHIQQQYPQYAENALIIAHRSDTNEWVLELENMAMIKFTYPLAGSNRIDYYANAKVFWNKYLKDCIQQSTP